MIEQSTAFFEEWPRHSVRANGNFEPPCRPLERPALT